MRRPSLPLAISLLALIISMTGTAFAATGGNFILGRANTAGATTKLTNANNGPALGLTSKTGFPSLSVSSPVQVPNLNASLLGGKTAEQIGTRVFSRSDNGPDTGKEATDRNYSPWGGTRSDGRPFFEVTVTKTDSIHSCFTALWTASNFVLGQTGGVNYVVDMLDSADQQVFFTGSQFFFNTLSQHMTWSGAGALGSTSKPGTYRFSLSVRPAVVGMRVVTDFNDSMSLTVLETPYCHNGA